MNVRITMAMVWFPRLIWEMRIIEEDSVVDIFFCGGFVLIFFPWIMIPPITTVFAGFLFLQRPGQLQIRNTACRFGQVCESIFLRPDEITVMFHDVPGFITSFEAVCFAGAPCI